MVFNDDFLEEEYASLPHYDGTEMPPVRRCRGCVSLVPASPKRHLVDALSRASIGRCPIRRPAGFLNFRFCFKRLTFPTVNFANSLQRQQQLAVFVYSRAPQVYAAPQVGVTFPNRARNASSMMFCICCCLPPLPPPKSRGASLA